jgi:hypothetical protein
VRRAILLLACWGCDGAERRDAETVAAAVQRFRSADLAATPAALEALRATPCVAADACEARRACVEAGEATASALTLKGEVKRGLDAIEAGRLAKDTPEARALPEKLDEAERLLKKGHEALPACDQRVLALKRRHRL